MENAHSENIVPRRELSAPGYKVGDKRSVFGWYGSPVWVQVELIREIEPGHFLVKPVDAEVIAKYVETLLKMTSEQRLTQSSPHFPAWTVQDEPKE